MKKGNQRVEGFLLFCHHISIGEVKIFPSRVKVKVAVIIRLSVEPAIGTFFDPLRAIVLLVPGINVMFDLHRHWLRDTLIVRTIAWR